MLAFLLLGMLQPLHSQQYTTSAGLRLGRSFGLTVNQRIARRLSVEGILQTNLSGTTTLHGLIRQHQSILTRRANLYYGAGIHTGSMTGIDGVLGVEATLARINFSIDVKPVVNIVGSTGFNVFQIQPAASVRYVVFKSGDTKKQRARKKKRRQRQRNRSRK
jgi:hypothetical protein